MAQSIALIGCGRIGFMLEEDPLRKKPCTHYGGTLSVGLKITHACDIHQSRLSKFAEHAGIPRSSCYTDYQSLISEVKPELVIIATWTESHAQIGIHAAENGVKVIVCEKPVASNLDDAHALIRACEKNGTRLIINHERRYDPRYIQVKKLLDSNQVGEVQTVNAMVLTGGSNGNSRIEAGGGPLLQDGTHMVDIIRYYFGNILNVRGRFTRDMQSSGFEDRATAWLRTERGMDIFLEAGGKREYFHFELQVYGTRGKIVIGNGYQHLYMSNESRYYTGFKDLVEVPFPGFENENYFTREYKEAAALLNGDDLTILSGGDDGLKALEIVHAVYLSAYMDRDVQLPLTGASIDLEMIFPIVEAS
ncbi:MAG TPA: Gfo/Idh/MocA family oxidoreductase [Spirochaetota bacterium]|nr:Gfo/Idh/MocA family oxidoreductase [Spirochaetota bacterium]